MNRLALAYTLFPDIESAHAVSRAVVNERLAACVNILGSCQSVYEWAGEVQESAEIPVLFKTTAELAPTLVARIAELHSYEVPAIFSWPLEQAYEPFAEWVKIQTRG